MWRALAALMLSFALVASATAEEPAAESSPSHPVADAARRVLDSGAELLKNTVVDGVGIVISPFKWRTREWLTLGAVGGATALFVLYADEPIRDKAQSSPGFRKFGDKIRPLGEITGLAALSGGMFLSGVILHREKDRETARLLIESTVVSYLIQSSLKHAIGRSRPSAEQPKGVPVGSREFEFFGGEQSMPSGEVTLAFTMAGVVTSQYDGLWLKVLAYSLAAAVGAGRIASNGHWASDTLLSAVIGTAVAKSVVYRHRKRKEEKGKGPRWEFALTPNGARYTYSW